MKTTTRWLLSAGLLAVISVWILILNTGDESRLRLVFCDVGQGDGVLAILGGTQMLVDGGPGKAILDCLDEYMPLGDKTIELVVATHPDQDHIGGLIEVLRNYQVEKIGIGPEGKDTLVYKELYKEIVNHIDQNKLGVVNLYSGDRIVLGSNAERNVVIDVVWPEKEWVAERIGPDKVAGLVGGGASGGVRGENDENKEIYVLGASTTHEEMNDFSIVLQIKYGEFDALLNGDADEDIQDEELETGLVPSEVEVMNAPHHGSRTGVLGEWLSVVSPELSVISVGEKNRYGHPATEILQRLDTAGIRYLRTDEAGDVVVESDGEKWWVEQ